MPRAVKTLARHRAYSQQLTRRLTDDDARERYRRGVLGGPGPIDCWLCVSGSRAYDSASPLPNGEVLCTVRVEHEPVSHKLATCTLFIELHDLQTIEDECGFVDPDTYTLSLTIATPSCAGAGSASALQVHPKIVLETYLGWKESMDAPDWTRRRQGQELVFRESRQELALLLSRVASRKVNVKVRSGIDLRGIAKLTDSLVTHEGTGLPSTVIPWRVVR